MKITLNNEASSMLIQARQLSDKNFNSLIKESMELLVAKYSNQSTTKEHNVQYKNKSEDPVK